MKLSVEVRYGELAVIATMNTSTKKGDILHPTDGGGVMSYRIRWFIEDGNEVGFAYSDWDEPETSGDCLPSSLLKKIDNLMTLKYRKYLEEIVVE